MNLYKLIALTPAIAFVGLLFVLALVVRANVYTAPGTGAPVHSPSTAVVVDCHGPHDCGYADNGHNGDH